MLLRRAHARRSPTLARNSPLPPSINLSALAAATVREVCEWLEALGLGQYGRRFLHNVVNGALLLGLSDADPKAELGIGPLGHRVAILQGIEELEAAAATSAFVVALSRQFAAARARRSGGGNGSGGNGGAGALARPPSRGGGDAKRPRSAPTMRARAPAAPPDADPGAAAFLGPAAGRTTVQEQRAKLLFELARAEARAAQQAGAASRRGDAARLAAAEVARLRGAVADLDRRFATRLEHAAGSLDAGARVPWQPVGAGTRASDPHPERHGRPWDGPGVDETFAPRISDRSREIMSPGGGGGGSGGFLDRLAADQRRRAAGAARAASSAASALAAAADPSAAARRARADADIVARCLGTRWGIALRGGGGGGSAEEAVGGAPRPGLRDALLAYSGAGGGGGAPIDAQLAADVEAALDEALESYKAELLLTPPRAAALKGARGAAMVAGLAAAVRALEFTERYRRDLEGRDGRLAELRARWFAAEGVAGGGKGGGGKGGGGGASTADARDGKSAAAWFARLGWAGEGGGGAGSAAAAGPLLEALLARAVELKAEWDKARDKAGKGGAAAIAAPAIDWGRAPWCDDGLSALMEAETARQAERAAAAAAAAAGGASKRLAAAAAAAEQGAGGGSGSGEAPAAAAAAAGDAPPPPPAAAAGGGAGVAAAAAAEDWLGYSVRLLAGLPASSLARLQAAAGGGGGGTAARLAAYRALRAQRFLEYTERDQRAREQKAADALAALERARRGRVATKAELDAFYERLQADGARRVEALSKARADSEAREAKELAAARAAAASPVRRPRSALGSAPAPARAAGGGSGGRARPGSARPGAGRK